MSQHARNHHGNRHIATAQMVRYPMMHLPSGHLQLRHVVRNPRLRPLCAMPTPTVTLVEICRVLQRQWRHISGLLSDHSTRTACFPPAGARRLGFAISVAPPPVILCVIFCRNLHTLFCFGCRHRRSRVTASARLQSADGNMI
ncbi:hypothetical protein HYALB_00013755 [Hymenoscyphus albidus]|uniref:Uncharacterized protein n=1 Tax=Hymenoscyphus albidus TaxID=595503 RepID=A0A9N9QBZ9_9HELO|nr:hypothetical protein HYALB_00013755 [Hymenoscyphus albidus]